MAEAIREEDMREKMGHVSARRARGLRALGAQAALAATVACLSVAAEAEVNIGVLLSLTGPGASLGIPERDTISLWPKQIGQREAQLDHSR